MQCGYSRRTGRTVLLSLLMMGIFLSVPPRIWALKIDEDIATVQQTSRAFSKIAKATIPTVVFIKVEQTVRRNPTPFQFNNPFDLFNDDFFKRFFGHRFPREYQQMGWGSGFIVSDQGYILTNHHVVGEADRITVQFRDGNEFEAKLIGSDPKSDVAIIQISGAKDLPVLSLGDSDALEIGEWVMAIGNPFGLSHTMTVGVVSAKGRNTVGITDYEDFIQTDAAINPGNSGGPLINMNGEAVGINSAIFSKSGGYMGIGFAIPINMVKVIMDQLIRTGEVVRGYLGVSVQDLNKDLVDTFGLNDSRGALIAQIYEDSPAEKAGLQKGDVIIEFNGKPIENVGQFRNSVALTSPGDTVDVKIIRQGSEKKFRVDVGSLDQATRAGATQTDIMNKMGMTIRNLTQELAQKLGYRTLKGVLVSEVQRGGRAYYAGIRPGMLILEVNQVPVNSVGEFLKAIDASEESKRALLLVADPQYARYVGIEWE